MPRAAIGRPTKQKSRPGVTRAGFFHFLERSPQRSGQTLARLRRLRPALLLLSHQDDPRACWPQITAPMVQFTADLLRLETGRPEQLSELV